MLNKYSEYLQLLMTEFLPPILNGYIFFCLGTITLFMYIYIYISIYIIMICETVKKWRKKWLTSW